MAERLILGLTGDSGSGKTSTAAWLAEERGFTLFEGSTSIKRAASAEGVKLSTRQSYEDFYRLQQQTKGGAWLAAELLACEGDRIAQVGLRSRQDFWKLRSVGGIVVALICPEEVCLDRLDKTDPKNAKNLDEYRLNKAIENQPDRWGSSTDWVIARADYQIDTNRSPTIVQAELDKVIEADA